MRVPKQIRLFHVAAFVAALLLPSAASAAEPKRNLAVAKTAAPATEARVALVIGNSSYRSAPLANPVNDARAISAKLKTLGFEVIERRNLTQKQVGSVLREFRSRLKPGGVALFFYAGHGLQVKGVNYFPVVDADIASEEDVPTQSLDANKVLELMDEAKTRLNLVFLDACRNNPYARSFRSAADGLAKVNAPSGTVISFATRPGSVAADAGSGRNGLYTEHLLAAMDLPDTAIEQALKRVVSGVKQASKGRQEPWMEGSIEGDFYFRWTGQGAQAARPPAAVDPAAIELAFWESIKGSQSAEDYKEYLKKYPNGQFAGIAKRRALNPPKPATTAVATIAPLPATKPKPEPAAVAGATWTDPTTGMEFVWIPKGCFKMGNPAYKDVCVEGFWLGKYEVTVGQYKKFRPDHGGSDEERLPVQWVSWNDATAYAEWLTTKTGKTFKLPTEAEWEYAARGGTTTAYYWGDTYAEGYGNYNKFSFSERKPVGSYMPNPFGLYDMLGNVWEWTASVYDANYGGGEQHVADAGASGDRVIRGGSWHHDPGLVRAMRRESHKPDTRSNGYGFRLARRS